MVETAMEMCALYQCNAMAGGTDPFRMWSTVALRRTFSEVAWELDGPRSMAELLEGIRDTGLSPTARHQASVSSSGVPQTDRSVYEH